MCFTARASTSTCFPCTIPDRASDEARYNGGMGQDIRVAWGTGPCPLAPVLEKLVAAGLPTIIVLLEGNLQAPHTPAPSEWREVRLKCQAGMVTLRKETDGIHVKIFGNADDALRAAQKQIAELLEISAPKASRPPPS
jgi:hypothetical protein